MKNKKATKLTMDPELLKITIEKIIDKKLQDFKEFMDENTQKSTYSQALSEKRIKIILDEIKSIESDTRHIIEEINTISKKIKINENLIYEVNNQQKPTSEHLFTHLITERTNEIKKMLESIIENQYNVIYRTNQISLDMPALPPLSFKKIAFKSALFFAQPFIVILLLKFFH